MTVIKNNILLFILFLLTQIAFGQTLGEKLIHGRVFADSASVAGINVVNLVNEKATITNSNGEFFILAKAEDLLIFSAINVDYKRKIIDEADLKAKIILIHMTSKITELDEVVIDKHPEINAVSLGIVPKGIKHYTPAERGRYSQPNGIFDAFKIMITGKNPARDMAIKVSKKIKLLNKIDGFFGELYYTETLRVPTEYIKGFQYYCIENSSFSEALEKKNKFMTMFLIVELAKNYNQLIACEKE